MRIKYIFMTAVILIINLIITGCTATNMHIYRASGEKSLCAEKESRLGNVAILPEVAWREDQKEPDKRNAMAIEEIERAFQNISCGNTSSPGGVKQLANWSAKPESELLREFFSNGVDTIILIRIEELSPRLYVTFSLPFLWSGSSEADFRIRALSTKSGSVLTDMRVKRFTGGPFNIRPAEWSRIELAEALKTIIEDTSK